MGHSHSDVNFTEFEQLIDDLWAMASVHPEFLPEFMRISVYIHRQMLFFAHNRHTALLTSQLVDNAIVNYTRWHTKCHRTVNLKFNNQLGSI